MSIKGPHDTFTYNNIPLAKWITKVRRDCLARLRENLDQMLGTPRDEMIAFGRRFTCDSDEVETVEILTLKKL